jgi:signal transduction histidine kinase
MLDRIESTVHQLHTIRNSLAHNLRSPLTAIRGKLETVWPRCQGGSCRVNRSAIDELDRLTEFLNTSLDVAEARADALWVSRVEVDLDELVRGMIDPLRAIHEGPGVEIKIRSAGSVKRSADPALLHRVIANLLDNELKHLPASCLVCVSLRADDHIATLTVENNGPGFDAEIGHQLFERRLKGAHRGGTDLGLLSLRRLSVFTEAA